MSLLNEFADKIQEPLITNDGEIHKKNLGIADIKINAHLLNTDSEITNDTLAESLKLVYQKNCKTDAPCVVYEKKAYPSENKEHNFGYQFRLCKPKKVIWIGETDTEKEYSPKNFVFNKI